MAGKYADMCTLYTQAYIWTINTQTDLKTVHKIVSITVPEGDGYLQTMLLKSRT